MPEVFEIGISKFSGKEILKVNKIELKSGKGIIGDRHFHDYNDPYNQLSLIESENIDYYNEKFDLTIPYINFRRNIITKGIRLNDLVGKKLSIGKVKVEVIDLCRPCKNLEKNLGKDNIIKEFLRRGGLRCEILNSSMIKVGDKIKCF
jgi:MOSC domain-containing protein YiiM